MGVGVALDICGGFNPRNPPPLDPALASKYELVQVYGHNFIHPSTCIRKKSPCSRDQEKEDIVVEYTIWEAAQSLHVPPQRPSTSKAKYSMECKQSMSDE